MNNISKIYTDEELISELHRFVRENGKVPTAPEMTNKNGYPSYRAYVNHFGNHNNALEAANLPLNKMRNKRTGSETCYKCSCYKKENQQWHTKGLPKGEVMCQNCYDNIHTDYMTGNLDINSKVGRGRSGEILVLKTLEIGKEYDCNLIKWGYKVDLYHDEYKKIDVKTSLLSYITNKWEFGFRAKKEADTYICIGLTETGRHVSHVWIVTNENEIKNQRTLSITNSPCPLYKNKHWEIHSTSYNNIWQKMLVNYHIGECKIFK